MVPNPIKHPITPQDAVEVPRVMIVPNRHAQDLIHVVGQLIGQVLVNGTLSLRIGSKEAGGLIEDMDADSGDAYLQDAMMPEIRQWISPFSAPSPRYVQRQYRPQSQAIII